MEGNEAFPRMVAADIPGKDRMYYLVDDQFDFIAEVKEFLDWKMATKRAPATIKAYCFRLSWYYRFLAQKNLDIFQATPADLTEFVIWIFDTSPRTSTGNSSFHQTTCSSVSQLRSRGASVQKRCTGCVSRRFAVSPDSTIKHGHLPDYQSSGEKHSTREGRGRVSRRRNSYAAFSPMSQARVCSCVLS